MNGEEATMWNEPSAQPPFADEALPPELEDVSRRIAADAVEWNRGAPSAESFNRRMRGAVLAIAGGVGEAELSEGHMGEQDATPTAEQSGLGVNGKTPRMPSAGTRALNRLRPMIAVAAAVLVVALLAGVFATFG